VTLSGVNSKLWTTPLKTAYKAYLLQRIRNARSLYVRLDVKPHDYTYEEIK